MTHRSELGELICRAIGIDPLIVSELTLHCEPTRPPTIEIVIPVLHEDGLTEVVQELHRYRLEPEEN